MDWGRQNRLSKIIKPATGKTVMLAVDHGYFLGPTTGLKDVGRTVAPLLKHADTLMLTRGILRQNIPPTTDVPIVLRVSGGSSIVGSDLSNEEITVSMRDAIRLNVSGVALSIFVGSNHEKQTLTNLARLIDESHEVGMPVIAVTAVGKEMVRDARYLGLACRIAAELGTDLVKTYYCDGFEEVVGGCPAPIVIAGGKKTSEKEALELSANAIKHGAVGVDMGRNIFQSDAPEAMICAVREVVHKGATANAAYEVYTDLKGATKP